MKIIAFSTRHPAVIFSIKNTLPVHVQRLELTNYTKSKKDKKTHFWGVAGKKSLFYTSKKRLTQF